MKCIASTFCNVRGIVVVSLIAVGAMFTAGCEVKESDQLNQGYADGVILAKDQPKSDGSTCLQKSPKLAEAGWAPLPRPNRTTRRELGA